VHRIGRTARAASKGLAITFINEKDQSRFASIEKLIEREIKKRKDLPGDLGEGPDYSPKDYKSSGKGPRKWKPKKKSR